MDASLLVKDTSANANIRFQTVKYYQYRDIRPSIQKYLMTSMINDRNTELFLQFNLDTNVNISYPSSYLEIQFVGLKIQNL
jgi:hypothetical protein